MKRFLFWLMSLMLFFSLAASPLVLAKGGKSYSSRKSSSGSTHVKGYTRKDGKYVAPHYRSKPDKSKSNNWSSKGNTNPYTGKKGTKDPNK